MSPAPRAMPETDVCIHGAGPVGSALALALSRRGLRVALVAQPPAASAPPPAASATPDIRAYALNAASVSLLDELRVWQALPVLAKTAVHEMRVAGDQGGSLAFTAWQQHVTELAWIVDAAALDSALAEALRYAPHVDHVTSQVPAAVQAICEGRQSATRDALGSRWQPQAYGHSAVAARLVSDKPHDGVARQWFRTPDVLALLPIDQPEAGRSYALVWSRPDADARAAAESSEHLEAELQTATDGAAGALTLSGSPAVWPLLTATAEPWSGDGWVLLGDAAHAVHPLAGQGLNLGLADVTSLARVLDEARRTQPWRSLGDARTLRRYARERALPTQLMNGLVDGLWQLFSRDEAPLAQLRNTGLGLVDRLPPIKRWLAGRALG